MHSNFDLIDLDDPPTPAGAGFEILRDADRVLFPIDEARRALGGISRELIYELIREGKLHTVKIRTRRFVPRQSILNYVAALERA